MIFKNVPNELMVYGTLFSLTNRIQTIGNDVFSEISMKQHFILMVIRLFNDNAPSLKDVADIVGCSYQNIKKLATALERNEYLKIERDKSDKRKYNLVLTEKVKTVSSDMDSEIKKFIEILYNGITQKQILNVFEILQKMDTNLKAFQQTIKKEID